MSEAREAKKVGLNIKASESDEKEWPEGSVITKRVRGHRTR